MNNDIDTSFFEEEANRLHGLNATKKNVNNKYTIGYFLGIVLFFILFISLIIYGIFAYGFVAMKLWAWFIVPVFHLDPLSILQCAGIITLTRLIIKDDIKSYTNTNEKTTKESVIETIGVLLFPWATLLTGYIIFKLM